MRRRTCALAVMVALLMCSAPGRSMDAIDAGPAAWPDTAPARALRDWMRHCATADPAGLIRWHAQRRSATALARLSAVRRGLRDSTDCARHGGWRMHRVLAADAHAITLLAEGRSSGGVAELALTLDADGTVAGRGDFPAELDDSMLPRDLRDESIAAHVRRAVAGLGERGLFSGIVLVARGTAPLVVATAGFADRVRRQPFTLRTRFSLGSLSKLFTSVAIGQLVEQGKIAYDDPVGKFFPDYPNATVRDRVRVGMLLSHTAGMGDFLGLRTPALMRDGVSRATDLLPLFDRDEPAFEPGTGWDYSDAGLALAGAIVERASGETFPGYLHRHVFGPAGMHDSDPNFRPAHHPDLATPYVLGDGDPAQPAWRVASADRGSPAGGAVSTARDLMRFAKALRDGTLLSRRTLEQIVQPRARTPWGSQYGYATVVQSVLGSTVWGHGGGFEGVSTEIQMVLDSDYVVIALANQDPHAAEWAIQRARSLVALRTRADRTPKGP